MVGSDIVTYLHTTPSNLVDTRSWTIEAPDTSQECSLSDCRFSMHPAQPVSQHVTTSFRGLYWREDTLSYILYKDKRPTPCFCMYHCRLIFSSFIRPLQVNSLFLVNFLSENLPTLQQKKNKKKKTTTTKNEGPKKKNELIYSVQRCNTVLTVHNYVIQIKTSLFYCISTFETYRIS